MERSVDRFDRRSAVQRVECSQDAAGWSEATSDEHGLPLGLLVLLAGEVGAFAALVASGNMPAIVSVLYRALLTF